MEVVTISLQPSDSVKDILQVVKQVSAHQIIFICPRHFAILSDTSFLKKLKSVAEKEQKEIGCVVFQKFVRDIMKSQDMKVYSVMPVEFVDTVPQEIKILLEKKSATKTQIEKTTSVSFTSTKTKPVFATHKIEQKGIRKPIRGKIFFGFLFAIILLVALWAWISPSATVTLKLKVSVIPVTQNVIVTLPEADVADKEKDLPMVDGIFVETEVVGTEVFPSTGRRYDLTNAHGKVTLFNETKFEKFLLPSRLSTVDGMIFRFADNVIIPPRNAEGAGRKVVEITADPYEEEDEDGVTDPIGARGNIEAGTDLFFPALRSESRELYYGRANKGPLVGGSTLTHYFIEEGDFEAVEEVLIAKFRVQGIDLLRSEIENRSEREKGRYVLLDDPRLLTTEPVSIDFPEELVGQEVQTFEVPAQVRLRGVVFDQFQVTTFLTEKLRVTQDHRKKLIKIDPVSAEYRVMESEFLEDEKWVKLSVEMQGVETLDIHSDNVSAREWREKLRQDISGKSVMEVRGILTNYPEIENVVDIKVSPFWAESLPNIFDQIEFEIR
jgi:hypothetical protein